jgi:hypothetical protein
MLHIIITWGPLDAKVIDNFLLLPPPPCNSGFVFDNRWVVPYNPYLTMQYQCHLNVAAARDEVQNYLDGRYVSANEACHQFFAFDLHDMHRNVYRLAVHLPNE